MNKKDGADSGLLHPFLYAKESVDVDKSKNIW